MALVTCALQALVHRVGDRRVIWAAYAHYGLPVIGPCNYRPVITAVITVIQNPVFQLPVICKGRLLIRAFPPLGPGRAARFIAWSIPMATLRNQRGEPLLGGDGQEIKEGSVVVDDI